MNNTQNVFLVLGEEKVGTGQGVGQKSLVGISSSIESAKVLIGDEWTSMTDSMDLTLVDNPLCPIRGGAENEILGYGIGGYLWWIVPVVLNEVLNFTLN